MNSPDRSSRYASLYLSLAVALSAVPLIALSRSELIGYDGFWHVFIARQDDWSNFWDEVRRNAHPPLFYLCLKAAVALFGASPVVYRLVPMVATLGSTWLVGRIVQKTTGRPWLPAVAAFAFGASLTTVSIGLDVRAYALGTFFMLWACLALLELVGRGFAAPDHRARWVFALTAGLALLTHYAASIFLVGCCVAAAIPALVDRDYRRRLSADVRRRWLPNLLTFGVPLAVLAIEYSAHISSWTKRGFNHLSTFLFDPRREGALEFVWRNTGALYELFVPPLVYRRFTSTLIVTGPSLTGAAVGALVIFSLAAVAWLGCRPARGGGGPAVARRVPPVLLVAMTALVIALALAGRYPYGGPLRHQFFLFPFAVIVAALVVDEVALRTNRRIGALAVGLFALASLANTANWLDHFRITRGYLWQDEIDRFRAAFPAPAAVQVDQFNLIHLFTHHHDRSWRFVRRIEGSGAVDVWRVGDAGDTEFYICRDRGQWQLDLSAPVTYLRMAGCLEATGAERVVVFRPQQNGTTASWPLAQTEEVVATAAERAGLTPETVTVSGDDVYAAFARPER